MEHVDDDLEAHTVAASKDACDAVDAALGLAVVSFRLPIELLGEIDHYAQQDGLVRNAWIRFALADAVVRSEK